MTGGATTRLGIFSPLPRTLPSASSRTEPSRFVGLNWPLSQVRRPDWLLANFRADLASCGMSQNGTGIFTPSSLQLQLGVLQLGLLIDREVGIGAAP